MCVAVRLRRAGTGILDAGAAVEVAGVEVEVEVEVTAFELAAVGEVEDLEDFGETERDSLNTGILEMGACVFRGVGVVVVARVAGVGVGVVRVRWPTLLPPALAAPPPPPAPATALTGGLTGSVGGCRGLLLRPPNETPTSPMMVHISPRAVCRWSERAREVGEEEV